MVIPAEGVAALDATRVIYGRFLLSWGRPDSANLYRYFPALFERLVALATRCICFFAFESWQLLLLSFSPYYILLCRLLLYDSIGRHSWDHFLSGLAAIAPPCISLTHSFAHIHTKGMDASTKKS